MYPSLGRQLQDYLRSGDIITVPPQWVGRCFVEGDLVFKKDLPYARFLVHYTDDATTEENVYKIHPEYIPLVRATYDLQGSNWQTASSSSPSCLVHRNLLVMPEIVHDTELFLEYSANPFQENWEVTVVAGPRKGYHGRVRKVYRFEVQVELQATQTIAKFKPKELCRRM